MKADVHKLKTRIYDRGFSQSALAKKIGIDRWTLNSRFKNEGETFRLGEIYAITDVLELSGEEIIEIFFCDSKKKI